jgi:NAD(P)H-dependent FMN reductase
LGLDRLRVRRFAEWDAKPVALVGYGWTGAVDATADLAKVLGHVKADVVGSTGLVFTRDVTPEGDLTVGDERRAELAGLLGALASRVDEPVAANA